MFRVVQRLRSRSRHLRYAEHLDAQGIELPHGRIERPQFGQRVSVPSRQKRQHDAASLDSPPGCGDVRTGRRAQTPAPTLPASGVVFPPRSAPAAPASPPHRLRPDSCQTHQHPTHRPPPARSRDPSRLHLTLPSFLSCRSPSYVTPKRTEGNRTFSPSRAGGGRASGGEADRADRRARGCRGSCRRRRAPRGRGAAAGRGRSRRLR